MKLNELADKPGSRKARMRVGRGIGSGKGKTAGRGVKGQKARTGVAVKGFEGGQMPLHRRLPKRGFTNIFRKEYAIVNVGRLEQLEGDTFSPASLLETGVIRKLGDGLKVLGGGELTRKITIQAHLFSKSALDKIQKAGGSGEVIPAAKEKKAE
jgi:large subunit ribosomal protein L15